MVTQRGRLAIQPRFIWLLLLALSVALFYSYQNRKIELDEQEVALRALHQEFYDESLRSDRLNTTLSQVNTDRYIEQRARKDFNYLMPDEIRFVLEEDPAPAAPQAQVPVQDTIAPTAPQVEATPLAPAVQVEAPAEIVEPVTTEIVPDIDWSSVFN